MVRTGVFKSKDAIAFARDEDWPRLSATIQLLPHQHEACRLTIIHRVGGAYRKKRVHHVSPFHLGSTLQLLRGSGHATLSKTCASRIMPRSSDSFRLAIRAHDRPLPTAFGFTNRDDVGPSADAERSLGSQTSVIARRCQAVPFSIS